MNYLFLKQDSILKSQKKLDNIDSTIKSLGHKSSLKKPS